MCTGTQCSALPKGTCIVHTSQVSARHGCGGTCSTGASYLQDWEWCCTAVHTACPRCKNQFLMRAVHNITQLFIEAGCHTSTRVYPTPPPLPTHTDHAPTAQACTHTHTHAHTHTHIPRPNSRVKHPPSRVDHKSKRAEGSHVDQASQDRLHGQMSCHAKADHQRICNHHPVHLHT